MTPAAERGHPGTPNVDSRAIDILIVEDDDAMRELLEQILRCEGYSVGTAKDGGEALAFMRDTRVRLVLLDLLLPAVNGYEFRNAQLQDDRLGDIPVVLTSGAGNLHVAAASMGVRDYLIKPLDYKKLLATVRKYLG